MSEFAETNVLLSVLEGDLEQAQAALSEFLVWELHNLGTAVSLLKDLINEEINRKLGAA